MKRYLLFLLLLQSMLAAGQVQIPISTFSSGGGGQGAGAIPAFYGSFGQPLVYPRPVKTNNGGGVLNANELMFPTIQLATEPVAQPTGLSFTDLQPTSRTLSFVPASTPPSGYIVLRKQGSAVTEIPSDGVVYTVGASIGSASVILVGTSSTTNETSLTAATNYFYAVFSYTTEVNKAINYLTSSPLTGNRFTLATEPSLAATGITFTNVASSSLTVSYTASASSPTGYVAVRRKGAAPTTLPADGTEYAVGASLGTGTIAYVGNATSFAQTGLDPSSVYHYTIYAFNGTTNTYNYLTSSFLTGNISTTAPGQNQPTNLVLSAVSDTELSGIFTAPVIAAVGFIVLRSTTTPDTDPVDGIVYTPGASLGNATIVAVGAALTFSDNGLTAATSYSYKIFSYSNTALDPNYETDGPLTGSKTTLASQPNAPTAPLSFTEKTASSFTVSFSSVIAPTGYLVVRRTNSAPTGVPVDGTTYTLNASLGDGVITYLGSEPTFLQSGLSALTIYHYAVYAYNGTAGTYNYSAALSGSTSTLAPDAGSSPSQLVFSKISDNSMTLAFVAALNPVTGYLILRKTGSEVTGSPSGGALYNVTDIVGDATVVYKGTELEFDDSGLQPGTNYFYKVLAFNGDEGDNTINYLNASPLSGNQSTLAAEPSAQATGFSASNITSSSLSLSFTAAAGSPSGYLVVRSTAAAFDGTPEDGVTYVKNQPIGTNGVVVSLDASVALAESGLLAETEYRYTIYTFNGSTGTYNYKTTSPLVGTVTTDLAPPVQPTNLLFTSITASSIAGAFTAAAVTPSGGYLVLRSAGALPTGVPVDGTTYQANDVLGDGVVIQAGGAATLTFTDATLSPATTYYYLIFSFNGSGAGTTYFTSSPLSGSSTTLSTEPSAQPTLLTFSNVSSTSYAVEFTLAPGNLPVIVIRNTGSAPSFVPVDGVSYTAGQTVSGGEIVSVGTFRSFEEVGLTSASEYFYAVYSYAGSTNTINYKQDAPLSGGVTTLAPPPTEQVTAITFSNIGSSGITVTLTEPIALPTAYLVLRSEAEITEVPINGIEYTEGATLGSATVVHALSDPVFEETGLLNATEYFYKAFAYNGSGVSSHYLLTSAPNASQLTLAADPSAATSLTLDQITTTSIRITINGGTSDAFLVIRSIASPDFIPTDGVAYQAGNDLGNGTIISAGNATVIQDINLLPGTVYFYKAYAFNGALEEAFNYETTGVAQSVSTESINQQQPSDLVFSSVSESSITGTFTLPTPAAGGYLVVRREGFLPTTAPSGGVTYSLGQVLGDGVIVSIDGDNTFVDESLTASTTYFYRIFSYTGTSYVTTSPLTGSKSTLAAEPTPPVLLSFDNLTSSGFDVSFDASTNATGYLVVRKKGSSASFVPSDGVSYILNQELATGEFVAYVGTNTSFVQSGLDPVSEYFYAVFAYQGEGNVINYNENALVGSETTLSGNPSQPTTLEFVTVASTLLELEFTPAENTPTGYLVLRGPEGGIPTGTPVQGASYSVGAIIGNGKVAYVGPDVSFVDVDLTPERSYSYKIFAFNGAGSGTTYVTESPLVGKMVTLDTEPGGAATSFAVDAVTTSTVEVTIGASPDSPSQEGYLIVQALSEAAAIATPPQDGVAYAIGEMLGSASIVAFKFASKFTFTELEDDVTYFYAVYPYRGKFIDGLSAHNFLVDPVLQGSAKTEKIDDTPPSINVSNTPESVASGQAVVIKATVTDAQSGISSVTMQYRLRTGSGAFSTPQSMTQNSGVYESSAIADVGELGIEYKVIATNGAGLTAELIERVGVEFTNPQVPASNLSFGTDQSKYNIVAVPLVKGSANKVSDVFDELGAEDEFKWRMFHYQPGGDLQELVLNSTLTIGNGYWLIMKETTAINLGDGSSVNPGTTGFTINLSPGYNQIGNPYMFNVSWQDVKDATGNQDLVLKTFNGNFEEDQTLQKFEGGFVSVQAATTLVFPPSKNGTINGRDNAPAKAKKMNPFSNPDWEVTFTLENGLRKDVFGGIGMHPEASENNDRFDDFTMPRLFEYIELNHKKQRLATMQYTKSIVPSTDEYTWEFEVETNLSGLSTMRWDNSYFGDNESELILWDELEQRAINMREVSSHSFEGTRQFKVIFGGEGYVKEQAQVKGLVFHQVFPNPASQRATITFSLPDRGQGNQPVLVTVTNQMGQVVTTVLDDALPPGFHEIEWKIKDSSGVNPALGVYIIQVNCGYDVQAKRIIIK